MRIIVFGLTLLLHGMAGCADNDSVDDPATSGTSTSAAPLQAMAQLRRLGPSAPEGGVVGWVNFTEAGGQLTIQVTLKSVPNVNATAHGLHVHAAGDCGGDGTVPGSKAGGHFNPDNRTHGQHAGDLGNVSTDGSGDGARTILSTELQAALTLGGGAYGIMGRSVVMHANPDDGVTDPAGNSGSRVLCGVIEAT